MTRVLVECDGVRAPANSRRGWDEQLEIRSQGPKADKTLRVQPISDALKGTVGNLALDLVRIASYMYWADQQVPRGGKTDLFGDSWRRMFMIHAPVSDPDVWNDETTRRLLNEAGNYLTDDVWLFSFGRANFEHQLYLDTDPSAPRLYPDMVSVFSGGADSLCAVVDATLNKGRRPALVSHHPSHMVDGRQKRLVELLRERTPGWHFPHTGVVVNKIKTHERDTSQRTRSLLYASLGVGVASALGIDEVLLADNGVVSLNLPINDQLFGALASRSTHPKFISRFNKLTAHVLGHAPMVSNPLWNYTRAETLSILHEAGLSPLLQETNSCSSGRALPDVTPHCGTCSQCVDRRFASLTRGMETHDLAERYRTDIFRAALADDPLTIAASYVRFARTVTHLHEEELFSEYPQLGDCVLADDPKSHETAAALANLVKRHGIEVMQVLRSEIEAAAGELSRGGLPPTSLIRLAVEGGTRHADAVPLVELTESEQAEVTRYGFRSNVVIQVTGELAGRKSNRVLVADREVVLPDFVFRVFLRLVVGLFESADGWVHRKLLEQDDVCGEDQVYNAKDRLLARFTGALPPHIKREDFIELSRGRMRLSTHRKFVRFDRERLLRHDDVAVVRKLAARLPSDPEAG